MKIFLSPMRRDDTLTVEKNGDRLRINGELFNFNPVAEGATIKASDIPCEWICSDVTRINGEIQITLILPYGADPSEAVAFPQPLENVQDGIVALPFDPEPEPPAYDIAALKANAAKNPYTGTVFTEADDDADLDEDEINVDA